MDYSFLNAHKIVPVVVLNKLEDALPTLQAMNRGGIHVAEITFRTACAADAIRLASEKCTDMLIGAGTVINGDQCNQAIESGAKFIVSPGFSQAVCDICRAKDVPYLAGVVTPTEIIHALDNGLTVLKFFPAGSYGGVKTLKALSAAFPQVKFLPTGGVSADNAKEYLSQKFVAAIGGSWMVKGTPEEIEKTSREAVALLNE